MNKKTYLQQFHRFQMNREKHFAPKFYRAIKQQYAQFLKSYTSGDKNPILNIISTEIYMVMKSLYIDAGKHFGYLVYSKLPKKKVKSRASMGFNEEIIKLIANYFDKDILQYSQGITETTMELIKKVMKQASSEGWSYNEIVKKLTEGSSDLSRSRSRLIARTETVTATNYAGYLAAAKTGLRMKKEWLSAGDNRVRPDHQKVNGSIVDFEDYFLVGDSQMATPGARQQKNGLLTPASEVCNCRCVALYLPQRGTDGTLIAHDYGLWPSV